MEMQALASILSPWLSHETWHTTHALDEKRYHSSLDRAFKELGTMLGHNDFHEAIHMFLSDSRPGETSSRSREIDDFAMRAELIGSYLSDVKDQA